MTNRRINFLQKKLLDLNLKKEAINLREILKVALTTDEDLSAKGDFNSLSKEEQEKIKSNMSIFKTLSEEQRRGLAHIVLDTLGLAPVLGEPADAISMLMYIEEEKYDLAAISLLCLIPAIGTVFGLAARGRKVISSRIIYEHADEIARAISKLKPIVPRMEYVEKAVNDIVARSKVYSEIVVEPNQTFSFLDEVRLGAKSIVSPESLKDSFQKVKPWFGNPEWVKWSLALIRNDLTRVLNDYSYSNFSYLGRSFSSKQKEFLQSIIPDVTASISSNLSVKFVNDPSFFAKGREGMEEIEEFVVKEFETKNYAGLCTYDGNNIYIYLPKFNESVKTMGMEKTIQLKIIPIISHEIWHAIDTKIFEALKSRYPDITAKLTKTMSGLPEFEPDLNVIRRFFNFSENSYQGNPTEIYVRIKSLKRYLGKDFVTPSDLFKFFNQNYSRVPADIEQYAVLLQGLHSQAWDRIYRGSGSFTEFNKDLQALCEAINNIQ